MTVSAYPTFPLLINQEISDPDYTERIHGTQATYDRGCRGVFCKKAHRERKRQQYRNRMAAQGREVKPYTPHFSRAMDPLIEQYYAQYLEMLAQRALDGERTGDTELHS